MRPEITDRYYRVFHYLPVDRVPDVEFGYWPQTIRRWLREGMPLELTPAEQNQMFCGKLDAFFGFEGEGHGIPMRLHMRPTFTEQVIEQRGSSVIRRTADGVVGEFYGNEVEDSSIPRYISFPVAEPADWDAMVARYQADDPSRALLPQEIADARAAVAKGKMISVFFCGFYGQLRNWMGMEALSYAFYDYPEMIHRMVDLWSALAVAQLAQVPADIPIDQVVWWEDMASKNGPLVSPTVFREFLQPGYHRVMSAAKARGCELSIVDSDGNPHDIVANWLEEGVNIMFPLEVAAGCDPYAWRREFGKAMRIKGAIGKAPLVEGGSAIDRELERLKPLLDQGGFIPHLDHLVPPDIPYKHYCQYLEKKRKLIGK